MELVIVESPNKAKKIQQLLGGGYTVAASVGHIADLPVNEIGVMAPRFEPTLVLTEKGSIAVAKLKKFVDTAKHVWLATDPDREGEAIAAHLQQFLHLQDYKRITFHEITKDAIMKALQNPRKIDDNLYQAQKARRVIDRLVGYKVSPELSKLANKPLSAGRVQSVALRLVVERERAIRNFKVTAHFGVQLLLESNGARWVATWDSKNFVTEDKPYVLERELAERIAKIASITIKAVDVREVQRKPPPPFITTTLQKAASLELGLDAAQTMQVAQKLFEDGLITYHRTDNPNLSDDCLPMLRSSLKNMGYGQDLVDGKNSYKAKINAQEAHEAIRPTDFLADNITGLETSAHKLYKLIRLRALASQMKAATMEYTTITVEGVPAVSEKLPIFVAKSKKILYPGWMKLTVRDLAEEKTEEEDELILPTVVVGEQATVKSSKVLELQTKPPARFTEAGLISKLEKEGIGRPATYAPILTNIKNRGYISVKGKVFVPEPTAELIVDTLVTRFNFMEIDYTRNIEEELDEIAQNNKTYLAVVSRVDTELANNLQVLVKTEVYPCPDCQAAMRRIKGKHGWFWGCSGYEHGCRNTLPDNKGKPGSKNTDMPLSEHKCPLCGKFLRKIKGKKGMFWGCSGFQDGCKYIADDYKDKPLAIFDCPKCNKRLRRLKGEERFFWSCSGFKEGCATTFNDKDGVHDFEKHK